jgi:hypothetical protein
MTKRPTKTNGPRIDGLTVDAYAKAKKLKPTWLRKEGLSDTTFGGRPAVRISYRDFDGTERTARFRLSLVGDRFRSARGAKLSLYGLPHLKSARTAGYVVLAEGESDPHTLWSRGFPALGLPGARSWRESWAAHLAGIPKIFVVIEPDRGGEAVLNWLAKSSIRHRAFLVRLGGAKDPSELYLKDPAQFKKNFLSALKVAVPWSESQHPEEKDESEAKDSSAGASQASQLIAIADSAQFFRSTDDKPYARIPVNGHHENWPVKSASFKHWLARKYYETERTAPRSQSMHDALNVITGRALYDGEQRAVFTRVGEEGKRLYLDLGDANWRAIEISSSGWSVVNESPVRFRRAHAMSALPEPVQGGSVSELWPFINVRSQNDRILTASWLVTALRARGPFPVLALHGEQGSGKSTADRVLRSLVDPAIANVRSAPGEVRDLMITANNCHVVALDNLSHLPDWLSDALCRLATGGGFSTRELYSDEEEIVFDAMRPILLNGIGEVTSRADLMERTVMLSLPSIPKGERMPEDEFWPRFTDAQPRILGALLDAVSAALRDVANLRLGELPRMADFAKWSTAAEEALGFMPFAFECAYAGNIEDAQAIVVESSPVGTYIRKFVDGEDRIGWSGTASELLDELGRLRTASSRWQGSWPKSANGLSAAIRRLAPNLRALGIFVEFIRQPGTGERVIKIYRKWGIPSSPSSQPSHG